MAQHSVQRVVSYVDGFNLYFGLRDSNLRRFLWLDIQKLSGNLLQAGQTLALTKYFTSRISGPPAGTPSPQAERMSGKRKRQLLYLEALGTLPDFEIHYGHYLDKPASCRKCGNQWLAHEEKMTDVNIAVEMLTDAHQDRFDMALLISADSDLIGPVRAIRRLFPQKRVVVACPPGRSSIQLRSAAHASFIIGRAKVKDSQFDDEVRKPDGFVLRRPDKWRPTTEDER